MEAATLVGRDGEVARLEEMLDALDGGLAGCVTVEGEPGIGKTRLLEELRERAQNRGWVALRGTAAEFDREQPYSVWIDALDAYAVSQDLPADDAWNDALAAELRPILPSVSAVGAGNGALPEERYRTHRAVRALLGLLAEDHPVVLVLDDLHWGDSASLELIAGLTRRPLAAPVLLALGFRSGQADGRLTAAVSAPAVARIPLDVLSEADAVAMLDGVGAAAAAAIYQRAGGNPFYLQQLGRADGSGTLPPSLRGAIVEELEALDPDARALLNGAAVSGEPFEPDLAAAAGGLSDEQALDVLDQLLSRDLVRAGETPRRFVFRHPLVRQTVYESAGAGWRLAAHARTDAALAARGAGPGERAHHVEQSAARGDEEAIALLLQAGAGADARAPSTAARWYGAALRLLPADDRERQVAVRAALAGALRASGDLELSRSTLLEAIELLEPDDPRLIGYTTLCATVEHWQGRHEDAHRRLLHAATELTQPGSREVCLLKIELAIDGFYGAAGNLIATLESSARALKAAQELGDAGLIAYAASVLALTEAATWRTGDARAHRELAIAEIERMPSLEGSVPLDALYFLGWAEIYLEEYDCAIERSERGVEIARSSGDGRLLLPMMLLSCYPLEMQGRLAQVNDVASTAVEIARLAGNAHYLFWTLFELAWARYFAGDLDGAIAAAEESVQAGGRLAGGTIPSSGGGPGWALAAAHFELGDTERAAGLMYELGSLDMERWIPAERCINWENLALAEIARGDLERATEIADRADAEAAQTVARLPTVCAGRTRAALEQARGDQAAAEAAARASADAAAAIPARLQLAFSSALLGEILAAHDGRRDEAVEVLRLAERDLDECGSVRARDRVRRELRKLGARSEVRGPAAAGIAGLEALTAREREIADLIADRLTNPQIAEKLFLSKKTVESHIRNLFVKLSVSSRVDIARMVERDRRGAAV